MTKSIRANNTNSMGDPYVKTYGTQPNYKINLIGPGFFDGQKINIKIHEANTGPATLEWVGKGVIDLARPDGVQISSGSLQVNQILEMRYNDDLDHLQVVGGTTDSTAIAIGESIGGGTAGSVLYVDPSGNIGQANATFFYDEASNRLIISGNTIPTNAGGLTLEDGVMTIKETTTPTPDADYAKIYTKADNVLYYQDGDGVEHALGQGAVTFSDALFEIYDDLDPTKIIKFQASGITTLTTRTLTAQDKDYMIADEADHIRHDGTRAFTGDQAMGGFNLTGLATPVAGADATRKDYVDALAQNAKRKDNCEVATTGNITLSGEQTIDGILTSTDRVLAWQQTDPIENGIYISDAGAWTRSLDADSGVEVIGALVGILQGTLYSGTQFNNTNSVTPTIGADAITFTFLSSITNHNDTTGLQGGLPTDYFHLTNAQHTDLTDAGDSALHYHATDRDRANHTGTQLLATVSDVTMTAANLNILDDGVDTTLHYHDSDRARVNHTGTQLKATISDFAHNTTHQSGGADAIKLDDLATPDDNTDLDVSITEHGLTPKLSNIATEFLSGLGTWVVPAGAGTVTNVAAGNGLDFVAITGAGSVILGTPTTLTSITTDAVTATSHTHAVTTGIVNTNIVKVDSATAASGEYARFTASGLESRSVAEMITALAHSATHQLGGADAIKLDDLATPDDTTDLDATAAVHGLLPKLSNIVTEFLNGQGNWVAVTTGTVTSVTAGNGMDFVSITATGAVTMGTPGTLTSITTNDTTATSHTHAVTTGIADTNIVRIDSADAATGEYAKLTADGIESKSIVEVKADLSLSDYITHDGLTVYTGTQNMGNFSLTGLPAPVAGTDATRKSYVDGLVTALATAGEINTGTDATKANTPDALAGSYAGTKCISLQWNDVSTDATTGTKKVYFVVPACMNGMNLVSVHAEVATAGVTGTETFDININGITALSTKLTIDTTETGSDTAATPAVIDTGADGVVTYDIVSVDVDAINSGTAAKGECVTLEFRLP